jgi:DNA repair exonuclease SbcCD ATPase subunit
MRQVSALALGVAAVVAPACAKVAEDVGVGMGTGAVNALIDNLKKPSGQAGDHADFRSADAEPKEALAVVDGKRRALEDRERTLQSLRAELEAERQKYARGVEIDAAQHADRTRKLAEMKATYRAAEGTSDARVSISGVKMPRDELRGLIVQTAGDLSTFERKRGAAERWSKMYEARVAKVDAELAELGRQRVLMAEKRTELKLASDTRAVKEVLREVDAIYTAVAAIDAGAEAQLNVDDLLLLEDKKPRIDAEFERVMAQ